MARLEKIVIPVVNFEDASIEEAINFLRMRSFELEAGEPERRGVSWIIKSRRSDPADSRAEDLGPVEPNQVPKINYSAKDVGLFTAMEEIARQAYLDVYLTNVGIVICGPGESPLPVGKMDGEEVWKIIHKEVLPHTHKTEGEQVVPPNGP
jgi:general secretion pathway protein D